MKASVGDEIVVDSAHTGESRREGQILEIREQGGVQHFRVRWDDGHETIFYPGSDAHVVHLRRPRGRSDAPS
jgi:hypothetical protein